MKIILAIVVTHVVSKELFKAKLRPKMKNLETMTEDLLEAHETQLKAAKNVHYSYGFKDGFIAGRRYQNNQAAGLFYTSDSLN